MSSLHQEDVSIQVLQVQVEEQSLQKAPRHALCAVGGPGAARGRRDTATDDALRPPADLRTSREPAIEPFVIVVLLFLMQPTACVRTAVFLSLPFPAYRILE